MISVVIPTYNASRFINQTIDSVIAQTFKDYEIIVVDDGSSDSTEEIVKSYGDKVRYIYQDNAGDGPARNTGIKAAKGEWIAFLDHDDQWLPDKLQQQSEFIETHPQLNWCATAYYQASGSQRAAIGTSPWIKNLSSKGSFCYFDTIRIAGLHLVITSTMMIRKSVFEKSGLYESGWQRCADMDLWWRIAYLNPYIGYITEPLSILHLDLQSGLNLELSLKSASGKDARRLIMKHLELARKAEAENLFQPLAKSVVKNILRTTLFNGLKYDARETMRLFPEMFSWYENIGAYVLTIAPSITSYAMRTFSNICYFLHLNKKLTRRYSHKQIIDTCNDEK